MGRRGFWRRRKGGMETCTTKPKHQTHFISSESWNTFQNLLERYAYIQKLLGTNDCLPKRVSKGDSMLYTTFLRVEKLGGSQSNSFPKLPKLVEAASHAQRSRHPQHPTPLNELDSMHLVVNTTQRKYLC